MKLVWVLMLVVACGKGKGSAPAAGSASGSAVVVVADAATATIDAAPAAPAGVLEFDTASDDATLAFAFDKKVPRLPAISADGKWLADYYSGAGGPMPVPPMSVSIRPIVGDGKAESLDIVDHTDIEKIEDDFETKPPAAALAKKMTERGTAIVKRLDGFQSLVVTELAENSFELPQTVKVGAHTFKAEGDEEAIAFTLTNAAGKVTRRAKGEGFSIGSGDDMCSFRPMLGRVFTDQAKTRAYVELGFRFRDDCGEQLAQYIVWELAGEDPDPSAAFAKDAVQIDRSTVAPATAKPETGTDLEIATAADGKSAWASLNAPGDVRASYVLALTPDGWRVIAVTSTKPVANAAANKDAKAGKLKAPPAFTAEAGDEALRAAFAKLTTDGMKAPASDLIAFGSGPGERTTSGATLAKGWNAAWKGKTTITSSIARLAPSGTTGWVAANVELAKTGYKIPFHIFAVFDKASSGEWTLVHLHFSV